MKKKSTRKSSRASQKMSNGRSAHTSPRAARFNVGSRDFLVFSVSILLDQMQAVLTKAEFEVCSSVLQGRSNNEIAAARGTSTRTVANQVAAIYRKLDVSSRTELAALLEASKRRDEPSSQ